MAITKEEVIEKIEVVGDFKTYSELQLIQSLKKMKQRLVGQDIDTVCNHAHHHIKRLRLRW
jgi:hypothetical protein